MAKQKCKFTDKMKAKRPCFRKGSFQTIIFFFFFSSREFSMWSNSYKDHEQWEWQKIHIVYHWNNYYFKPNHNK